MDQLAHVLCSLDALKKRLAHYKPGLLLAGSKQTTQGMSGYAALQRKLSILRVAGLPARELDPDILMLATQLLKNRLVTVLELDCDEAFLEGADKTSSRSISSRKNRVSFVVSEALTRVGHFHNAPAVHKQGCFSTAGILTSARKHWRESLKRELA